MPSTMHTLRHLSCDSLHGASSCCTFGGGVMSGFAPQTLSPPDPLDDAPTTPMPPRPFRQYFDSSNDASYVRLNGSPLNTSHRLFWKSLYLVPLGLAYYIPIPDP